jgi:hypothetical protein
MRPEVRQGFCYFGNCVYLLEELLLQEGSEEVKNVVDGAGRVQQVQLKQKMVQQDRALHRMEVSTRGPTRALYVPARDLAAVPYVLYDVFG